MQLLLPKGLSAKESRRIAVLGHMIIMEMMKWQMEGISAMFKVEAKADKNE